MSGPHPSHQTRPSDASTYDEICTLCGAHDEVPGGWGKLAEPCPNAPGEAAPPEDADPPPGGDPLHADDEPFKDFSPAPGVQVHNTEHNPDGSFRRFVKTPLGLNLTFPHTVPRSDIAYLAATFDQVASTNFEGGKKAAQAEIRNALGL